MELSELFSFKNLYNSYLKCCKGVNWKTSTKNFKLRAIQFVSKLHSELIEKKYKSKGFFEFDITERGKSRHIKSVHISERVVQKCLCDYWLYPLLSKRLIYDNGATIKGKGLSFALARTKCHLQKYCRKFGASGYVLTFFFRKFFESIDHKRLKAKVARLTNDKDIFELYCYFVDQFGERGLGLGSQISQISALYYLSDIDHFFKEKMRCKFYARYMDDGYIVHSDKKFLQLCKMKLCELAKSENVDINESKTKISKLENFKFLKRHWRVVASLFVKVKPFHKTIARFKKRFAKLKTRKIEIAERFKASVNGVLKTFKNRRLIDYVYN